jgi:uncharacterized protein YaaQ
MPENNIPASEHVDQLILVVVTEEQSGELGKKLVAEKYRFTVISASNGILPAGTSCLMLGIASSRGPDLLKLIESVCKTRRRYIPAHSQFGMTEGIPLAMIEAEVGSANVYILPVEYYEYF